MAKLILNSSNLQDWSPSEYNVAPVVRDQHISDAQYEIVEHIRQLFIAEFNPTFDDLLAKGYIKVAHALKRSFAEKLISKFGEKSVLIAPIKDLRRCKAKLTEIKGECEKKEPPEPPPYASRLMDFLRATVLCDSIPEMVEVLEKLSQIFTITRVKPRLDPKGTGNKVVLTNLIVEDPTIRPHQYPWSGWWDEQTVRMIGEVQIALKEIFYLDKQAHSTYEIKRTASCAEWEYQQGYDTVEQELFQMSPLHNDPLCLL